MKTNFKTQNVNALFLGILICLFSAIVAHRPLSLDIPEEEVAQSITIPKEEPPAEYNVNRASELFDEIFPLIALCEGSQGEEAYYCGARWTLAYGVTVYPDGRFVRKGDRCTLAEAKEYCRYHICNRVVPFFKYTTRKMTDQEIMGTTLFIYNVGGENFSGYSVDGREVGEPSSVLLAINAGENAKNVADCMTGFRKSAGKLAKGLLKVRWVQGAVYLGIITPENVQGLVPCKFYNTTNLGNYYELDSRKNLVKNGCFCCLRYDDITISGFFKMNAPREYEKTVAQIIP